MLCKQEFYGRKKDDGLSINYSHVCSNVQCSCSWFCQSSSQFLQQLSLHYANTKADTSGQKVIITWLGLLRKGRNPVKKKGRCTIDARRFKYLRLQRNHFKARSGTIILLKWQTKKITFAKQSKYEPNIEIGLIPKRSVG